MAQRYIPDDIGWDLFDTPNPKESGVAVTAAITGLTEDVIEAMIGQPIGQAPGELRQQVPQEWAHYTVTHWRRHLPGTITLYGARPKTAKERITPFNSKTITDHGDWHPILKGFLGFKYEGASYTFTNSSGISTDRDRYAVKRVYHPSYSGPCQYIINEYLSEVPFPESLVSADNAPVPSEVNLPAALGLSLDFGKCLHPRFDFTQLDLENLEEAFRVGELRDAFISLAQQTFEATNVTEWVEYQVRFDAPRTDGDKGQYYGIETIILPPPLPDAITG
jgi:hypothetical protein